MNAPENILDLIRQAVEISDAEDTGIDTIEPQRVNGAHGPSQTHSLIVTELDGTRWLVQAAKVAE